FEITLRRDDEERSSAFRLNSEGVRDAARRQQRFAGAEPNIAAVAAHAQFADQDVKDLVLVAVNVQRRRVPERDAVLDQRNAVRTVVLAHPDVNQSIEKPELVV